MEVMINWVLLTVPRMAVQHLSRSQKVTTIVQENNNITLAKGSLSPLGSSTNEAKVDENKKSTPSNLSTAGLNQEILATVHRRRGRGRAISQSPRRQSSTSRSVTERSSGSLASSVCNDCCESLRGCACVGSTVHCAFKYSFTKRGYLAHTSV